jgi:hypothetical protein
MATTRTLKRITTGALLAGGVAVAGMGLGAGTAQANCNALGVCGIVWCPGQRLPASDVKWDMNVCHHYYSGTVGERGTGGGIQVGAHIIEGEPTPVNTCAGHLICLPGL